MSGQFRVDRSLLLERDPEALDEGRLPLESIRSATWMHQRHAMAQGYNSLVEMAVDELAGQVRELKQRVDSLERQATGLHRVVVASGDPYRQTIGEDK